MAGRVNIDQPVLSMISNYTMQTICNEIEKSMRQFIWGATEDGKELALISWNTIESKGLWRARK